MRKARLGKTDLNCSILGLGTWGLGGVYNIRGVPVGWKSIPRSQAENTIRAALDAGINFIDTSDFYGEGQAEELIGQTVPKSTEVVIATKGGLLPDFDLGTDNVKRDFGPKHIEQALHGSLRRLKRQTVDLYQLHGPASMSVPDETWETLERLRMSGKLRYIGVSIKSRQLADVNLDSFLHNPLVSTIQIKYNLQEATRGFALDKTDIKNCALLARSPLGHGFLTGKYASPEQFSKDDHRRRKVPAQFLEQLGLFFRDVNAVFQCPFDSYAELALRFVVSSPVISLTIVGATASEQIADCVRIVERGQLSNNQREVIYDITRKHFR
jgi:aryl-alcohol dehydrogenase-like predicted oxidoreductase